MFVLWYLFVYEPSIRTCIKCQYSDPKRQCVNTFHSNSFPFYVDFGSFNALCKYKPSTCPTIFPFYISIPLPCFRCLSYLCTLRQPYRLPPKYLQPHQFTRISTHSIKWVFMPLPQYTASFCRSVGISQKQWGSSSVWYPFARTRLLPPFLSRFAFALFHSFFGIVHSFSLVHLFSLHSQSFWFACSTVSETKDHCIEPGTVCLAFLFIYICILFD